MRAWLRATCLAALVAGIVAAGFLAGFGTAWIRRPDVRYPISDSADDPQGPQRILWEVWHLIETEFYEADSLTSDQLSHGAIAGLVASLNDPHTSWIEPTGAAILREDMTGRFEGIGATVDMVDGVLTIINPLPNSPAAKAGLRSGDVVLEADGRSLGDMDLLQAVMIIRGPEGTAVELLIRRGSQGVEETFTVNVDRAELDLPTVEFEMLPDQLAYLRLYEFNGRASREVRLALEATLENVPSGLILDLRNNPGGLLSEAISVGSQFLGDGVLLIEKRSEEDAGTPYEAESGGLALDISIVVLVNEFSASASEIVAGAIQDRGRGVLIGTHTYGKGSMQIPYALSDQSSFIVTVARWFTPNGRQIEGQGLLPDISVEMTEDDLSSGRDPQLDRAVQFLLEGR